MASLSEFLFGDLTAERERAELSARLNIALNQIDYMAVSFVTMQAQINRLESVSMASGNWDAFYERLNSLINGFRSAVALNKVYETEIANTDTSTQTAVADAVAADDTADQAAIDKASDAVGDGLNPPADPSGDQSSPDDSSQAPSE